MKENNMYHLGLDVGSVSLKTVVIDSEKNIIEEHYNRTKGQPLKVAVDVLSDILTRIPKEKISKIGVTGSAGKLVSDLIGGNFINEVIAQAKAMEHFHPDVRTVIEMGGEDSKLILLKFNEAAKKVEIADFAMNGVCAAGTGSFLDQQATRLGFNIEEFSKTALKSKNPPRIAGRCSVFAKSDMIHLQQIATPDYDIIGGLCYAMARNFKSTIGKGKDFIKPVSFQGGVAANEGMRKAFEDILGLKEGELIIPKHFYFMGAIGVIFHTMEDAGFTAKSLDLEKLKDYRGSHNEDANAPAPLKKCGDASQIKKDDKKNFITLSADNKIDSYLGIDVGSVSTNVVVIDEKNNVLSKRYLPTAGRPIEAVKQGLKEVGDEIAHLVNIKGVGTTGSGRYLTGDLVGADVVRNEITAQATAAIFIDPEVDTIFEIGGQDSKYISIDNGAVVDFEMNKVCAAGTGSFLEEQAERLGISIKKQFGSLALNSSCPSSLGEKCTVFIESDLVHHQQRGASTDQLVAGLSYSIVHNYLNRVVEGRRIGNRIFFQGGVAANAGVVSAFEQVTGKKMIVPEHHDVTGAIGVAILAKKHKNQKSRFKGFDLSQKKYEISTFECRDCSNVCEIRQVSVEGEKPLYYGSRCEKYDIDESKKKNNLPDLFEERNKMLLTAYHQGKGKVKDDAKRIGIPRALFFYELLPMWRAFFTELGFKVVLSDQSNKDVIHKGIEKVVAEQCFPIKVIHGHLLNLMEKGVDYIFLPSFINLKRKNPKLEHSQACPYVQAVPYTVRSAIEFEKNGVKLLDPPIELGYERKIFIKTLYKLGEELGRKKSEIDAAWDVAEASQENFYNAVQKRGKEILDGLKPGERAIVIVSRPYNGCDPEISLHLPQKLKDLGTIAIPMDFLPLDDVDIQDRQDMYWKSGQRILAAAHIITTNPMLYALYITNFSCGPDSFIAHFFRDKMKGKPYLQIEIDEHSADAGAITRLEAFLDSLENADKKKVKEAKARPVLYHAAEGKKRKIYLPYMADHAFAIAAAFEANGIEAEVLPEPDEVSLKMGRKHTSGKECVPAVITAGDVVRLTKKPGFEPEKSAFFMPSGCGPCRFGQYNRLHRLILDEIGHLDVPIFSPNQDENFYKHLGVAGNKFIRMAWQGIVAIDVLERRLRETRPYERNKGESDEIYQYYLKRIYDAIRGNQGIMPLMEEAAARFDDIQTDKQEKPVIGIVGEIYLRSNKFANENIVKKIESLGGEAWMPSMTEWFFYTNFTSMERSLKKKSYGSFLKLYLTNFVQRRDEHKIARPFEHGLRNNHEPTIKETIDFASPYLHKSFEGEAILSVGKAVDFYKKGVSGIVNVMPFTCMPGTIVGAILKRFREEYNNIPCLNMAYDGQKDTNSTTRLEAFVHQTRHYMLQQKQAGGNGHDSK